MSAWERSGMKILGSLLFVMAILSSRAFAEPNITKVAGTLNQGSTLTINGTGFGAKKHAAPIKFDDFENGTVGNDVGNGWVVYSSHGVNPKYSTAQLRPNSKRSAVSDFTYSTQYNSQFGIDAAIEDWYISVWMYMVHSGAASRNVKPIRILEKQSGGNAPDVSYVSFPHDNYGGLGGQGCSGNAYLKSTSGANDITTGVWERRDYWFQKSDAGVANGNLYYWKNMGLVKSTTNLMTHESGCGELWERVKFGNFFARDTYTPTPSGYWYWDDVYIDDTRQRVELCDAATWTAVRHCEIQIPSQWTENTIAVNFNKGSFSESNQYIYVVDANGNANPAGYPVSSTPVSTTRPNPPTLQGAL